MTRSWEVLDAKGHKWGVLSGSIGGDIMNIRVGDKIKYDTADSNFCCYGNVMKVCPKSVVVLTFGGYVVRVKNKDIACVY